MFITMNNTREEKVSVSEGLRARYSADQRRIVLEAGVIPRFAG